MDFKIPEVISCDELIDIAFKRASKEARKIKGSRNVRKRRAEEVKVRETSRYLRGYFERLLRRIPRAEEMTKFYYELVDCIIGVEHLKSSLLVIERASKAIEKIERDYTRRIRVSKEPHLPRREFYGRAASILRRIDRETDFLRYAREQFKELPVIEDTFTVVISGAPNVGKSSLLRRLTSAKPRIESYPFTTKQILLGYLEYNFKRIQLIDTPGLLDRAFEKRNKFERQAILALKHLADLILNVFDPSETCGFTAEMQINLYNELCREFKNVMPVINKADLLDKAAIERFEERLGKKALVCSAEEGSGIKDIAGFIMSSRERL